MSLLIILACIVLLVLLITRFKFNTFLAFLLVSLLTGLLLGMPVTALTASVQKGMGDLLGSLAIVIVSGAMLGKLVAESGAAQQITSGLMKVFGTRNIQWALMITGFIVGIPLFYNVGFVLVIPLIFSAAYRFNLPVVYIGVPMLASLSVTHGFLPPHPSPTALVGQFNADMGLTLVYGIIIAIPTVILAGPLFARTLKKIQATPLQTFMPADLPEDRLPALGNSIFSSLLPVILLALTTLAAPFVPESGSFANGVRFFSEPDIVMLLALLYATWSLGIRSGMSMERITAIYGEAVKDISLILLIIAGAGALKQIMVDSGVSTEIAGLLQDLDMDPLVLGWLIAATIRVCMGSATVSGLTAAGIVAPAIAGQSVDPNLMVLSIGAGSLMFSHVNDSGFWMFKEYFNLSIMDTIKSWSLMETIVAIAGLAFVLILDMFV
ncbi:MAG: gluconate:H+ symporter [Cyclobacteriaceae bacterium]|jgi:Gnt-I system high-affinity gluconate transporter|nr:gluconate:H+ symporter [Cyclobacteriaceae bacterium]